MGFNDVPSNSSVDLVSLKVSHGNEIRRLTVQGTSYASLCESTADLFGLDRANLVLKYQDDDDDKISMSSDVEFQEAIRLYKQMQKVLRLFVEVKLPVAVQQVISEVPEAKKDEAVPVYLGPGGRFGGLHKNPHHHAYPHHHAHPHPHPHPHPHNVQPYTGPQPNFAPPPVHTHGSFTPVLYGPWGDGEGKHHGPEHHRHHYRRSPHDRFGGYHSVNATNGTFSAASNVPEGGASADQMKQHWRDERKAYKESKKAMKESWRAMKKDAVTDEDRKALKELKEKMKNEMRKAKSEFIAEVKCDKKAFRALGSEKEKKPRFVARHVEDVTIPDGTELPPNTPFLKTWKIRNEGPAWPTGSQLLFVSHKGDNLNGPERVVIKGDVLPGQEVEVSVPLITPNEPGRYVGYYRMVTPDGVKFGQRVWVSFFVVKNAAVASMCDNVDA